MDRRQVVLMIVEGPSDQRALEGIFNELFSPDEVHVHVCHCDITTHRGNNPGNIVNKVTDIVKTEGNKYFFNKSDYREIIHITDTDGAFVPETCVVYDPAYQKPFYDLSEIRVSDPQSIIDRNLQKSQNIERLLNCSLIWGKSIPYHLFYMSSNLDHVLFNRMNTDGDEKRDNAFAFAEKYKADPYGFLNMISDPEIGAVNGYQESWQFIKKECHSLERHTNLALCFEKNSLK